VEKSKGDAYLWVAVLAAIMSMAATSIHLAMVDKRLVAIESDLMHLQDKSRSSGP